MAERGFSLVEVLVCLSLLALGVLALAGASLAAQAGVQGARARAALACATGEALEVARALASSPAPTPAAETATLAWRDGWQTRWQRDWSNNGSPLSTIVDCNAEPGVTVEAQTPDGQFRWQRVALP